MKVTGASIKLTKQRGEWAELRFMARAAEHGLCVNKPWGESSRYDFAIEHGGKFLRVQVKSTTCKRGRSYVCNFSGCNNLGYTRTEIDFIAAYVVPKNIWYIFPITAVSTTCKGVVLSPHLKISKYGIYQEAWHLLCGEQLASQTPPSATTGAGVSTTSDGAMKTQPI